MIRDGSASIEGLLRATRQLRPEKSGCTRALSLAGCRAGRPLSNFEAASLEEADGQGRAPQKARAPGVSLWSSSGLASCPRALAKKLGRDARKHLPAKRGQSLCQVDCAFVKRASDNRPRHDTRRRQSEQVFKPRNPA